jgi:SagB-type dehydrogenase family enzyme
MSLEQALGLRRSVRSFGPGDLSLAQIGQLLWAGQGITSADGKRTAPSAGALYPLELYVVTPTEIIHYLPDGHRVETRATPDVRRELGAAALGQESVPAAPGIVVIAAARDRTRRKYGDRADAFVELEAGHAAQNILLQATALGMAAVPIGAIDPDRVASVLALPSDQTVLYLIPVGPAP